jgi:ParB family chromosome partitioning protein
LAERRRIDLGMTGYDELFMNDADRKENRLPKIRDIPLSEIDDFPDHPYQVRLDEDMDQLVQSIKDRGIITPITLRQNAFTYKWQRELILANPALNERYY